MGAGLVQFVILGRDENVCGVVELAYKVWVSGFSGLVSSPLSVPFSQLVAVSGIGRALELRCRRVARIFRQCLRRLYGSKGFFLAFYYWKVWFSRGLAFRGLGVGWLARG